LNDLIALKQQRVAGRERPYRGSGMQIGINKLTILIVVIFCTTGCTSMGVEPWERDVLAKEEMQLVTDSVEAGLDDHIYFSKEASSGGRGFGGGGCGCN
jgi:hypothetical protein